MFRTRLITSLLCVAFVSGCANLAPDYARPELPVAATFDGVASPQTPLAEIDWQRIVTNDRLKTTIELALINNRDLRVAALNIEKARAQYHLEDAALYPALSAGATGSSSLYQNSISRKYTASVGVAAYELDFFGRLSNLSEAALQTYFASQATQRSVRNSLIAEVGNAWLTLAAYQDLQKLARETLASREKTLTMTRQQQALGGASRLALAQAQAVSEAARGDVANYASQVEQARNALTLLVGTTLPETTLPPTSGGVGDNVLALVDVPAGLSSDVLLRRPDVAAAEHALRATYADIGAARAAFFPSITLTGSTGSASPLLDGLFDAGTRAWSFVPTLTLPIFNAGKLKASLSVAEIQRDIGVATYEKTIQTAFSEAADALAVRASLAERMAAQQGEVDAYATSLRLSTERYRSGADSYLSVLDSQRSLYTAQKTLIALQLVEQANRMTLFKVLGGS